jgi:iron complex outermembrane recepter protein
MNHKTTLLPRLPFLAVRRTAVAALCAGLGGLPAAALAQAGDAVVVVTGTLQGQRIVDAPFAITAIGADTLQSAGPMVNLSESLQRVPGLLVANRNNYAQDLQISSRGFGARATFGVRGLRLYADGIPATMPDGQGQVAHFDLAGAQRIEVLRGPFSVLYGNSSGGVIALFSAPATEKTAELALDVGSDGLRQERIKVAAPFGQGFDIRATVSNFEFDGFRPHQAAERTLGNVRLGWQSERDRVTVLLSDHHQDAQDPLGLTLAQFRADPFQTASQAIDFDTRKTIEQTQVGVNWRHRYGSEGLRETAVTLYKGERSVTQFLAITPAVQAPARHGGGVVDFDRDYAGAEARAAFQWGELGVVAGLAYETMEDDRRGFENFVGTGAQQVLGVFGRLRRDETNRATSRDAFAQAEWAVGSAIAVTGGVRTGEVEMKSRDRFITPTNFDDSGELKFRYMNPVVGVRWKLQPGWALHASVARGFESPTLGDVAYRPDGAGGFNDALQGQKSRQLEVGSKWRSANVELDATLFAINNDNEIGVQTNQGGRSAFQNVGRTQRRGAELAGAWQIAPQWRVQAAASWLDATYRDTFFTCTAAPCATPNVRVDAGNRIAGTQRALGFAEAAWKPGWVPGEFAVEWRAVARTAANDSNSEFAPGYALAALRWRAQFAFGAADVLDVLARVDNVTDREYAGSVIVNEANGRFYEPGAPRSYLLSVRWQHRF